MARILTLHDPAEARDYYESGLWRGETLYGLAACWAAKRGDAPALRDPSRRLNWRELVAEADVVAAALHGAGLSSGDRVSVFMRNRVEAVIVFLACSRNGYVFNTSLHATYTPDEVATWLERVESRALFGEVGHGVGADRADMFALSVALPSMRVVFALATGSELPAGCFGFPEHLAARFPVSNDPDKVVYLAFTSGTSGIPKGVMHSDNSLLANARAMVTDWGHDHNTVLLTLSQMSHHIGTVALTQSLVGGFELVLSDPTAGIDPIDWIERTGATYLMGVPTHAMDLLAALEARGADKLGQVATFYLAGAPIPRATAQSLLAKGITPQNVYGMTENGSHQYTRRTDPVEAIIGTCGKACDAYEVKLFRQDDRDTEVDADETGEIGGRGAMRMLGYFGNQTATEASFNAGGWFMTGDLGQFDEAGNLAIVGRTKDIIIRGGHNIHPARIEDLALRHPAVRKAAAVAVPDARLGERVCLVLVVGAAIDGAAMLTHLDAAGLSNYDMPEYLIVTEQLPLGPTGKILKRELSAWIECGRLVPVPIKRRHAEVAA